MSVPYDLVVSSLLGVVLFVVIFSYNKNTTNKADSSNNGQSDISSSTTTTTTSSSSAAAAESSSSTIDNDNETNEDKELKSKNKELLDKYLSEGNEENLIKKTAFLQKKFGIPEEDIKRAIKDTRKDLLNKNNFNLDDSLSIWKMIDWFIYLTLFCAFCYFFNVSTNGDFGRVVAGIFPREFETLGLKKFLEAQKIKKD